MNIRSVRPFGFFGLLATVMVMLAAPGFSAPAQPIDDLQQQADELADKIETQGAEVQALGEKLNDAQIRLDEAEAKIAEAEARISEAEARVAELEGQLEERAAVIYRNAGNGEAFESLEVENSQDSVTLTKYSAVTAAHDQELLDEVNAAKEDLEDEKANAEEAGRAAEKDRDKLAAAKAQADDAAAALDATYSEVTGEIADLVAEEQARRAAAAAAPAPPAQGGDDWSPPPGVSGGAGAAVAYAQAQVGKAYCYAGTGPTCYDCSGLTMMAWRQGGVDMPHSASAQGSMFPHVPLSQLQPGDLVTTSGWSQHVGIWVGGGYVHASNSRPYPQGGVKYVAGLGQVTDAVRPG